MNRQRVGIRAMAAVLTFILLVFGLWAFRDVFVRVRPEYAPLARAKECAQEVARTLDDNIGTSSVAVSKRDLLRRLSEMYPDRFLVPPFQPERRDGRKVAFYFPFELDSSPDGISLLGYSEPILSQKRHYRILLFRRTDETAVSVVSEIAAHQILGQYATLETPPDLFCVIDYIAGREPDRGDPGRE